MPIEFRCGTCQKLLRTPDDKAGVEATCPQCGSMVVVPIPEPPPPPPARSAAPYRDEADAWIDSDEPEETPSRTDDVEPADVDDESATRPCPMCGAEIRAKAKRCKACGETLPGAGPGSGPSTLVASDVLSRSWALFQAKMSACIGGTVLMMGISYGIYVAFSVILQFLFVGAAIGGRQDPQSFMIVMIVFAVAVPVVVWAVVSFLLCGWTKYMLNVVRGEKPDIGEIFRGGAWWLRMFASCVLAMLLFIVAEVVLCGAPIAGMMAIKPDDLPSLLGLLGLTLLGYLLSLVLTGMFLWAFPFLLVDQDTPGVSCLSRSFSLLSGKRWQSLLIILSCVGLIVGGYLMCCFGLIFTAPLAGVILTVAYCDVTGQPTE